MELLKSPWLENPTGWSREHREIWRVLNGNRQASPDSDRHRLKSIMKRVTFSKSTAAVTARVRDLRKPEYGSHTAEARPLGRQGGWSYWLLA